MWCVSGLGSLVPINPNPNLGTTCGYVNDDHIVKINTLSFGPLSADLDGDSVHLFYP